MNFSAQISASLYSMKATGYQVKVSWRLTAIIGMSITIGIADVAAYQLIILDLLHYCHRDEKVP